MTVPWTSPRIVLLFWSIMMNVLHAATAESAFHSPSARRRNVQGPEFHGLSLVPSQVRTNGRSSSNKNSAIITALVPSQVLKSPQIIRNHFRTTQTSPQYEVTVINLTSSASSTSDDSMQRTIKPRRRRKRRKAKKQMTKTTTFNASDIQENTTRKKRNRVLTGDLPDIHWRSIPMEHLRFHPNFSPLPPTETITHVASLEEVRQFRQGSWQWDALHEGRCTTSQATDALGFLEPLAGRALDIPMSWRRGGVSAYHRLRGKALRTLDEMNAVLCEGQRSSSSITWKDESQMGPFWAVPQPRDDCSVPYPFAAKYLDKITPEALRQRRQQAERFANDGLFMSVRMSWGNAQEATALLTALNYFWKIEPKIEVKEVGMCGAGLLTNVTQTTIPSIIVGASPDALLCYPNGTVEALEVKNHCPFVPVTWDKGGATSARYAVRDMPFRDPSVPPVYIPQLMMEMLCVGPHCRSAIMVRQTATNGAVILRLHRDDGWIEEMLFWLNQFQREFVEQEIPPPTNFFWNDEEHGQRYRKFVHWTKELATKVDVVHHVKHREVQRVTTTNRAILSLFLD